MSSISIYNQIVSGYRSINAEIAKLEPSSQVFLYEIDLTPVYPQTINTTSLPTNQPIQNGILRIYNDYNLYNMSTNPYGIITWKDKQFFPMPIFADGFEMNSAGTLPTPRLFISNNSPDSSTNSFYKYIRMEIESLGDIVGAKFTRIKTFLKYLKGSNFSGNVNPFTDDPSISEIELPKDVYYIDRKNQEDNLTLEYTLGSILDVEGVSLPGRTIFASKCPFQYRGEGCLYEYDSRRSAVHSGVYAGVSNPGIDIRLLQTAPPVATENDQLFIGPSGAVFRTGVAPDSTAITRITGGAGNLGAWSTGVAYVSGDFIYLQNNKLNYYFVCINNHTSTYQNSPPNAVHWLSDSCSKSISACRLRWLKNPAFRPVIWPTNRGGWTLDKYKKADSYFKLPGDTTSMLSSPAFVLTGVAGSSVYFPRRPAVWNPMADYAHGIPKDYTGGYLNGFLPFGGFPGTDQPNNQ